MLVKRKQTDCGLDAPQWFSRRSGVRWFIGEKTKTDLPASLAELSPNEAIRLLIVRWLVLDKVSSLTSLLLSNFDVWGNSVKCSVSQQLMRKTCLWRWQSRAGPHREEATLWIDQLNLIYVASPGRVGRSRGMKKGMRVCIKCFTAWCQDFFFFFPRSFAQNGMCRILSFHV